MLLPQLTILFYGVMATKGFRSTTLRESTYEKILDMKPFEKASVSDTLDFLLVQHDNMAYLGNRDAIERRRKH